MRALLYFAEAVAACAIESPRARCATVRAATYRIQFIPRKDDSTNRAGTGFDLLTFKCSAVAKLRARHIT